MTSTAKKRQKIKVINVYERMDRSKPSSVVKPSLSLSDSVLMIGKCGLPGRILKLILDENPVGPSSYIRLAASYSIFSCSACAKNG